MNKNLIKISIGILVLCLLIRIGVPFEIKNNILDSILRIFSFILVFLLIYKLSNLAKQINNKKLKFGSLIILRFLSILFILGAFWNNIIRTFDEPHWYNLEICVNQKGTKILRQVRESGSIYDNRDRLVLYEFDNENRISINVNFDNYSSNWKIIDLKTKNIKKKYERCNKL